MTKHLFNKVMHSVSLCLTLVECLRARACPCTAPALSTPPQAGHAMPLGPQPDPQGAEEVQGAGYMVALV